MDQNKNFTQDAVVVKNLHKSYKNLKVLLGVSFTIKRGTILALLGPNGAGKTTTIKILSTLLLPNSGELIINGFDVVKQPDSVQANIGLTGQFAAVDDYLTGEENLSMMGRLYRLSNKDIQEKVKKLLEQFDLVEAAHRRAKTYSGGMKRRLDLAMSLIASPPVLFLDEPTTGLDPNSRLTMWKIIKQLAKSGTTILLTTQYMDEADKLADNIIVIDNGKVIAEGTPETLKKKVGSDMLEVIIENKSDFEKTKQVLADDHVTVNNERQSIHLPAPEGIEKLKKVLAEFEKAHIKVENISLHKPTLDDVFVALTGHGASDNGKK